MYVSYVASVIFCRLCVLCVRVLQVAIDLMTELQSNAYLACYSETAHPLLFQFALGQVKDKLLEDSLNVQMLVKF